jgi:hypothetical protein
MRLRPLPADQHRTQAEAPSVVAMRVFDGKGGAAMHIVQITLGINCVMI